MPRPTVDLELEQIRTIVRDLDGALDPVSFARLHRGTHDVSDEALRLYGLFHKVSMWCWLTRHGLASDGGAGLLRDLHEMSR
jgi:hypothetical protein